MITHYKKAARSIDQRCLQRLRGESAHRYRRGAALEDADGDPNQPSTRGPEVALELGPVFPGPQRQEVRV